MSTYALVIAVLLACVVEAVEAVTIILAAGTARDWRSSLQGTTAGLLLLAAVCAVLGPSVNRIPLDPLRLFVGTILLIFGLQWLRKAILRASGYKALHDEDAIFRRELAEARAAQSIRRGAIGDWYSFVLCFKAVVLEGLEVVLIVVTFGANQHRLGVAALAGAAGVILVTAAGVAVRAPLSRVPENAMKFAVGIMLTAYGAFWGAEGAHASWPGEDASLLWLIPAIAVFAVVLVVGLRAVRARQEVAA